MTGEQLREILKEKGYSLSKIAELLNITPQTLNSRLRAKTIKDEYVREIEDVTGNYITHNTGNVNTGTVGGHNINLAGTDYQKIIDKDRIELKGGNASKIYLQEIASLKAETIRLEAIIKSKDETIAAKDETIEILRKK